MSAMPPPPPHPSLGRVLIIDDELTVGGMVQAVLTAFGYAVKHAGDGVEGLQLIRLFEPNVVLLDLKMPGMSGLEVLDYLRRDYPEIPVLRSADLTGHLSEFVSRSAGQLSSASASMSFTVSFSQVRISRRSVR